MYNKLKLVMLHVYNKLIISYHIYFYLFNSLIYYMFVVFRSKKKKKKLFPILISHLYKRILQIYNSLKI